MLRNKYKMPTKSPTNLIISFLRLLIAKKMGFLVLFFNLSSITVNLTAQETDTQSQEPREHILTARSLPNLEEGESTQENEISNWEARLELARVLSYLKRYSESLQEYQKLLETDPKSPIARREMAAILFYMGKIEASLQEFSQVPNQDRDEKTWLVIADIYVKQKRYQNAEEIYNNHLNKEPKDDRVRLKLASLLSWQKRYHESIQQYRIILNHIPHDIQVRRKYAQVLTWMGSDEEAIVEWKKTLP